MPDTLEPEGFDPERHIIGEEAFAQTRDLAIRAATAMVGDTQVSRLRPILLLMAAAVAVCFAPIHWRVPGVTTILLVVADISRRRPGS